MTRTRSTTLIALALVGVVIGFLLDLAASSSGRAIFVPPISLPLTLVAIAIVVVVLAVPIRRAVTGRSKERIDPFRAMRVAALAKAIALAGALLAGVGVGILFYLLSRSSVPVNSSIWMAIATAVGAAVMLVGGLVAEYFCTLPPGDDDDDPKEVRA